MHLYPISHALYAMALYEQHWDTLVGQSVPVHLSYRSTVKMSEQYKSRFPLRRKRPRNKTNTASTRLLRFHGSFFSARFCSCIWRFVRPSWSSTCLQMRNGLISVDAYKKSRAFYIYEWKLRYCIEVFFRVRKRASGNASMEKVLCVSVLVKFPRADAGVSAAMESGT